MSTPLVTSVITSCQEKKWTLHYVLTLLEGPVIESVTKMAINQISGM